MLKTFPRARFSLIIRRNVDYLQMDLSEPNHEKMCLMPYANNKGADQTAQIDQPAHPRSLISAFVVRCFGSIISQDSIAEISKLLWLRRPFVSRLVGNSRRHVKIYLHKTAFKKLK